MIRVIPWAIGLLFFASAMPVLGQEDDRFLVFRSTWVPATLCNPEIAMRVDLAELAQNAPQWGGVCVAVKGYSSRFALFTDLRDAQRPDANWAYELENRRVGLYGKDGLSDLLPGEEDGTRLAVGRVGLCEDLRGDFDFVSNYCHSAGGAYIALMHEN